MRIDNRISFANTNRVKQQTKNISSINFSGSIESSALNTKKAKGILALGSVLSLIGGVFIGNATKNVNINIDYSNDNQKNITIAEKEPENINADSLQLDTAKLNNQAPSEAEETIVTTKTNQKKSNDDFIPGPNFDYSTIKDPNKRIQLFLKDPTKTKEEKYKFIGDNDPLLIQARNDIARWNAMAKEMSTQTTIQTNQAILDAKANEERVRLNNQLMMDEQRRKMRQIELERVMNMETPRF